VVAAAGADRSAAGHKAGGTGGQTLATTTTNRSSQWDGLPAHRSKAMGAWLRRQRSWLVVERLPGYAPDLNPVEPLWSNLKGVELANLAGDTLDEVIAAAERGIVRIGPPTMGFSFLRYCGLSLW
jgi:hypothetical protein